MFERRLKVILLVMMLMGALLVLRAAHVQIASASYWAKEAEKEMVRPRLTETTRGRILDYRGQSLAEDAPCLDVAVDYRAVVRPPEAKWVAQRALERLRKRDPEVMRRSRAERKTLVEQESREVIRDIEKMWDRLAAVREAELRNPASAVIDVEETRRAIIARVSMRKRMSAYRAYQRELAEREQEQSQTSWKSWLLEGKGGDPEIDRYVVEISDEQADHVVLQNVDRAIAGELARDKERYPGLALRQGAVRRYPFANAAAHLIGSLSRVSAEDMANDPWQDEDLRHYSYNDLIGRAGIERLCEPALRGSRGQVSTRVGSEEISTEISATPGNDVRLSIDVTLQAEVQEAFKQLSFVENLPGGRKRVTEEMFGAAVLIDVPTGQVRVLASYPDFDPNTLDRDYSVLLRMNQQRPLMNRATQFAVVPGSTIKPMIGLAAITEGIVAPATGIECDGYLRLDGRKVKSSGKCWTVKTALNYHQPHLVGHHQIPFPHVGRYGNLDGHLCFSDALERSCNVYFETAADRMGITRVLHWLERFGLGRKTGIGIAEVAGSVPALNQSRADRRTATYLAGIGQQQVRATPLQMANLAATIARNGIWKRPTLLADATAAGLASSTAAGEPDTVNLKIPPDAIAAAREGMISAVYRRTGTGTSLVEGSEIFQSRYGFVAGKTGTAQAAKYSEVVTDPATGKALRDANGKVVLRWFKPSNAIAAGDVKWMRGHPDDKYVNHSWLIGFAPAAKPQVAFCVFVEYGGSGGGPAAALSQKLLEGAVEHGYLKLDAPSAEPPQEPKPSLRDLMNPMRPVQQRR